MCFSSDEVNILIYQYLRESHFIDTSFIFANEANIDESNLDLSKVHATSLIRLLRKGFEYSKIQCTLDDDGDVKELPNNLNLIDAAKLDIVGIEEELSSNKNNQNKSDSKTEVIEVNSSTIETPKSQARTEVIEDNSSTVEIPKSQVRTEEIEANSSTIETPKSQVKIEAIEVNSSTIEIPQSPVKTFFRHATDTFTCAWSPSVDFLASGSSNSTVKIWDISNQNEITFKHCAELKDGVTSKNKDIISLDWHCAGYYLATGDADGDVRVWSMNGSTSKTLGRHHGPIYAMKWSKKGSYLASGGKDQITKIWTADDIHKRCVQKLHFHSAPILDIAWRTNEIFASCSADRHIYVCKLNSKNPLKRFEGHTSKINAIEWNPQSKLLASCSDDKTIKIWSMKHKKCVIDFKGHSKEVYTIKWSPKSPTTINPNIKLLLASASFDTTVRLWDIETSLCDLTLSKHTDKINTLAFSSDGKFLATSGNDKFVYIWSLHTRTLAHSFQASAGVTHITWNSIGNRIAVSACDGNIFVLDLRKM